MIALPRNTHTQPWAFEYTPASSESAEDAYLKKARDADFLVWLVGSQTTKPVFNEINARITTGRRLLVFKLPAENRDPLTRKLLTTVSGYCKWQNVNSGPEHFLSCGEAKMALFDFIEVFYNQRRRHSTLGQVSPAEFERRMMTSPA